MSWEDIATEALQPFGRSVGCLTIEQIADRLGVRVVPFKSGECGLIGNTIMVSPRLAPQAWRSRVALALAHWLIARHGFGATEAGRGGRH